MKKSVLQWKYERIRNDIHYPLKHDESFYLTAFLPMLMQFVADGKKPDEVDAKVRMLSFMGAAVIREFDEKQEASALEESAKELAATETFPKDMDRIGLLLGAFTSTLCGIGTSMGLIKTEKCFELLEVAAAVARDFQSPVMSESKFPTK